MVTNEAKAPWTDVATLSASTRNLTDDLRLDEIRNLKLKAFIANIDKGSNRLPLRSPKDLAGSFLLLDLAIRLKASSWIIHRDTRIAMCRFTE